MVKGALAGLLVAALLPAGCVTSGPQPRDGRAGLQMSGTVGGSHVAVSDGNPRLIVGDCDVVGGAAEDVCVVSHDVRGQEVTLALRNPAVLAEGERLVIEDPGCAAGACDSVTDVAVVDVTIGDAQRRATGGTLTVTTLDAEERYAGGLRIELPDGVLSGHFDVVPQPD